MKADGWHRMHSCWKSSAEYGAFVGYRPKNHPIFIDPDPFAVNHRGIRRCKELPDGGAHRARQIRIVGI